jgi:putative transposase
MIAPFFILGSGYLTRYETLHEVKSGLNGYFEQYNHERLHQSLGYKTPASVYLQGETPEKA